MSVFLGYHYPCLDGVYSACSAFLFFRDIQRVGATAQDFIEYIARFESFEDINRPFYKWKFLFKEIQEEEAKASDYSDFSHEYSPKILKDVVFLPCRITSGQAFNFPYEQYSEEHLQKSVLILMDYSSGTAANIRHLCQTFLKVIILDHHLTFENVLIELSQYGGIPSNLLFLYNKEKSGATVTFEFFEKVKGRPILVNKDKYKIFQEILSYVEDNDIRAEKVKNSAQYVSAVFKKKLNFDANANESEDLFRELIEANPEALIEIGIQEEKERSQKAHDHLQNKHIVYLGGKTKDGDTGRFGKCYGVKTDELELRSEIGHLLAKASIEDKLENMGFVYGPPENETIKVSVRSVKGLPGGDCESIAREYQGGGHFNASGFHLSTTQLQEWI